MPDHRRKALCAVLAIATGAGAETKQINYFGHNAQVDKYGVIAPWYHEQNGQFDLRVRIAA